MSGPFGPACDGRKGFRHGPIFLDHNLDKWSTMRAPLLARMIRISIHRAVRGIAAPLSFGSVDFEDDLRGLERPVLLSATARASPEL